MAAQSEIQKYVRFEFTGRQRSRARGLPTSSSSQALTYTLCKSELVGAGYMTRRIGILLVVSCILCGWMTTLPPARAQTPAPGTSFRECSNGCPEMVVVQQGRFTMGAPGKKRARIYPINFADARYRSI